MKSFDFPYINDSPVDLSGREGAPRETDTQAMIAALKMREDETMELRRINTRLIAALNEVAYNAEDKWARDIANTALKGVNL